MQISVQPLHAGRTMASAYVAVAQGERTLCGGLVLLDVEEPDVLRHTAPAPAVVGPEGLDAVKVMSTEGAEIRIVDGADLSSLAVAGPAGLDVWVRWGDPGTDERAVHQAISAWFTDPFLIPAALRPHEGLGLGTAHDTLSTGVLNHTLTFHESFRVDEWLLLSQHTVHGGGGRTFGEGHVFTREGRLVASFSQENMIRYFPDGGRGSRATSM